MVDRGFELALNYYFDLKDEPEMQRFRDYEIVDYGIEHVQYFQGIGATRDYEHVCVGIGMTYSEALDDALEHLASHPDVPIELVDQIERQELVAGIDENRSRVEIDDDDLDSEIWYHVGIRFNCD